jgi:hypothetical protein
MADLQIIIAGSQFEAAAQKLSAALAGDGDVPAISRLQPSELPETARKVIDPIALASLILSIPAALLTVADLVDRMRKRKRAQAVIDAAKQVRDENGVSVSIVLLEGAVRRLDGLTADELLEEAAKLNSAQ